MTIREAADGDFDRLMELKMLCKEDEFTRSSTLKPPGETREHYARYLRQHLAGSNSAVFVAPDDGRIVAMIQVKTIKSLPLHRFPQTGYISNLYVLDPFRGKGVGTQLVERAMRWLRERGVRLVSLELHVGNLAATELYRKLGFEEYTVKMSRRLSR